MPIPTLIPIPTPIAVANESADETQAKNLFSHGAKTTWTGRVEQAQRFHLFHEQPVHVVFELLLSLFLHHP
jgi:hypothetical protein